MFSLDRCLSKNIRSCTPFKYDNVNKAFLYILDSAKNQWPKRRICGNQKAVVLQIEQKMHVRIVDNLTRY